MFASADSHPYPWSWASARTDRLWISKNLDITYLDELDWVFRTIELADSPGWKDKQKNFQRDVSEVGLKGQYLELSIAARLIENDLSISFPIRPDIVVNSKLGIGAWSANPKFSDSESSSEGRRSPGLAEQLEILEEKIYLTATQSKVHQAVDYPTVLAAGISNAGDTWIRSADIWVDRLRDLLSQQSAFAGLVVASTTFGAPYVHSMAAVAGDRIPLPEFDAVCRALGGTVADGFTMDL